MEREEFLVIENKNILSSTVRDLLEGEFSQSNRKFEFSWNRIDVFVWRRLSAFSRVQWANSGNVQGLAVIPASGLDSRMI